MSMLKCKMCGGDLLLVNDQSVVECEYCGSRQTVPAVDDDKKLNLFARANRLRFCCEFDKAAGVYESIVAEYQQEAEAYWGLLLCKYGIEYVDDPITGKKIPTCHRSSFNSVMEDNDFEQTLENADVIARKQYRDEAKQIEELRKSIIAVSANEEPYDIFICYKESDSNGDRTLDSVLAQDIYDALIKKNYRVFFSRITLEDKLGVEYEPYIFAALNSAKLMLVVGTDYEYFNAVWVKNEWSRYLKLMANDSEKHLIPCFKGIDAYDMPNEFARLQAQDLGKVGAMQDLIRGIEKLLSHQIQNAVKETAVNINSANATEESLLKRAFMFIEDENWNSANEYCEKVLDINPENASAYLGKLFADLKISSIDALNEQEDPFDINVNYQKAIRFADDILKDKLNNIYRRWIEKKEAKEEYLKKIYQEPCFNTIACGGDFVCGLHIDGTAVLANINTDGYVKNCECEILGKNISSVSANTKYIYALRTDGTVVAKQYNYGWSDIDYALEVSKWKSIIDLSPGEYHAVSLKVDGTVLAIGANRYGQCEVSDWKNIVAVSAGGNHTVGLKADGTVVAVGHNKYGQCDVSGWKNIVAVSAAPLYTGGLHADGTAALVGSFNVFGIKAAKVQIDIVDWKGAIAMPKSKKDFIEKMKAQMEQEAIAEAERKAKLEAERKAAEEKRKAEEEKRLAEIKAHNDAVNAKIAQANVDLAAQKPIYSENSGKIFGAGAKLKKPQKKKFVD